MQGRPGNETRQTLHTESAQVSVKSQTLASSTDKQQLHIDKNQWSLSEHACSQGEDIVHSTLQNLQLHCQLQTELDILLITVTFLLKHLTHSFSTGIAFSSNKDLQQTLVGGRNPTCRLPHLQRFTSIKNRYGKT